MNGRNHVLVNTSCLITAETIFFYSKSNEISEKIHEYIWDFDLPLPKVACVTLGIVLFLLGSLLPDIDTPESGLGRFLYVPIQHRTWTHTLWLWSLICLLPAVLLSKARCMIFLWFGCILHILIDNLSRGGVCFFYPLTNYIRYGTGAFTKKYHILKLYSTGKLSERVVAGLLVGVNLATTLIVLRLIFIENDIHLSRLLEGPLQLWSR